MAHTVGANPKMCGVWNPSQKRISRKSDHHVLNAAEGSKKIRTENDSPVLAEMQILRALHRKISMDVWG